MRVKSITLTMAAIAVSPILALQACSVQDVTGKDPDAEVGEGGAAGESGAAGSASGSGGAAGSAGAGGQAGSAGTGGAAGQGGTAGTGGQDASVDAEPDSQAGGAAGQDSSVDGPPDAEGGSAGAQDAASECSNTTTDPSNCGACGKVCDGTNGTAVCVAGACDILCSPGYANCDGNVGNGCEVTLTNDPQHCGSCTNPCAVANGTPGCVSGSCTVASCTGPFQDCNGQYGDGCESNINTSSAHCGSCNHDCDSTNGTAVCIQAACTITCSEGWGNCDGILTNGCETDLKNDENHCGECTTACSQSGGTPSCNAGVCGIACSPGLGDCNATPGCETNVNNDVNNCGGCGLACSTVHGTPTCASGACTIVCATGYANCDGNVANGCETDLNTDMLNCGACTNKCNSNNGVPKCVSGTCTINCNAGRANCNTLVSDGCEVNLTNDKGNCGSCGYACTGANGTSFCNNSQCGITCSTGYRNCNGVLTDGCEVNINNDPKNCGGCGNACSTAHGTAGCSSGQCTITCSSGWYDCDNSPANGCETFGACKPSCTGLATDCGVAGDEPCCATKSVSGGTFYRSYDGVNYQSKANPATVAGFYLDRYEITVGRFRKFVEAYPTSKPAAGSGKNPNNASDPGWDPGYNGALPIDKAALTAALKCYSGFQTWTDTPGNNENRPINCITWYEAYAFCIWDGARLPTEAEWNFAAAGGGEQRVYPWSVPATSTAIDCTNANYANCVTLTADVGTRSSDGSKFTQRDMSGNVWEWVQDWHSSTYPNPCDNCAHLTATSAREARGGSFLDPTVSLAASKRSSDAPTARRRDFGARCARN